MPLLDIANAQPCFHNNIRTSGSQFIQQNCLLYRNEKRLLYPWKSLSIPRSANNFNLGRIELWRGRLITKAVVTLESTRMTQCDGGFDLRVDEDLAVSGGWRQSSSGDLTKVDEREKLRRTRISKANKGNTPWNKGKKHSPETLQRIRERTRLAMQDPKVKMKLVNLGHAQSQETRIKIGVGVRSGWEKRREKLMLQETCHYEWQNLIAEAAKRGLVDDEELQWDSYKIIDEQLKQEWIQSVEERKRTSRPKGSKRAPKSLEQRRKISAAIAAKWADPAYRERVYSGLAKYHGTPEGAERKQRRKPSGDGQTRTRKRSPSKRKVDSDDSSLLQSKSQIQRMKLKRSRVPLYKDPLVSSKLEMLKNIRAQRAEAENKRSEAISKAKLLIAEAEKAAKALEVAANKSPIAHASLIESRKLIAEAVQSIMSIENGTEESQNESTSLNLEGQITRNDLSRSQPSDSEGISPADSKFEEYHAGDSSDDREDALVPHFNGYSLVNGKENHEMNSRGYDMPSLVLDDTIKLSRFTEQFGEPGSNGGVEAVSQSHVNGLKSMPVKEETGSNSAAITKKWVRGRLVEVTEST